jgi:two-component system, NarL family, sensor kinase
VQISGDLPALPAAVEVAAYRIIVEAVTNTVRHASAGHCEVSIAFADASLAVTVTDDGTGFATTSGNGNGLAIMRERAEELGGEVKISDASPGLTVTARLPTTTTPAQAVPVAAVPA